MPNTHTLTMSEPFHGLLHQLFEVGGPVMIVLVAIALAGVVTFVYLMLSGALFAPRLTRDLKKTVATWQQQEDNNKIRETIARDAQLALEPFEAPLKL